MSEAASSAASSGASSGAASAAADTKAPGLTSASAAAAASGGEDENSGAIDPCRVKVKKWTAVAFWKYGATGRFTMEIAG
jgi:hypothetical protein